MNEQIKELIAIGASVAGHCQPCLTYHVNKARELGLSADDIRAAIETGRMVEQGALKAMHEFSQTVLDTLAQPATPCCCGSGASSKKSCCA